MNYRELSDDLDNIMSKESGRRFISNLLDGVGVDAVGFCSDAAANAYWQGRRSVGVAILAAVRNLTNGLEYERQMRIEERARLPSAEPVEDDIYKMTAL